ncbi:MAG: DUF362 domain-containing protein [Candidatus Helarchaeota archaeon]|nr:DUF362 domain-containing protein [Candidatus Helarchaeota archaeon]
MTKLTVVAIVKGKDHYKTTRTALDLISNKISRIEKNVLITPNLLTDKKMEAVVTNPNVCMAIADFLYEKYGLDKNITLGAGTTAGKSMNAVKNNEYLNFSNTKLLSENPWDVKDLNEDKSGEWFPICTPGLDYEMELGIADTAIKTDYLISAAKLKTHDVLGFTLTLKNLMGALSEGRRIDTKEFVVKGKKTKPQMHGFGKNNPNTLTIEQNTGLSKLALAINITRMGKILFKNRPHLAVLDAITAMEGDGPLSHGIPKQLNLIIAGTDVVAVDRVACEIAGSGKKIQYILQAGKVGIGEANLDNIEIIGESIDNVKNEFKMHRLFKFSEFTQDELKMLDEYTN